LIPAFRLLMEGISNVKISLTDRALAPFVRTMCVDARNPETAVHRRELLEIHTLASVALDAIRAAKLAGARSRINRIGLGQAPCMLDAGIYWS
jgi:hypothetical protein